ncbi:MAG: hypothetical protein ACI4Q3_01115 [Kiritimatiellia bacterium]
MKESVTMIRAAFGFSDAASDAQEKRVVARYSRGNVKFSLGLVTTKKEYEEQKRRVLAYDFR